MCIWAADETGIQTGAAVHERVIGTKGKRFSIRIVKILQSLLLLPLMGATYRLLSSSKDNPFSQSGNKKIHWVHRTVFQFSHLNYLILNLFQTA
jgi:hypothetical protein